MDRLQASWARDILGCRHALHIGWSSLRLQCGWDLRLSSRVVLGAIMALARLQLLPVNHPGSRMLALAASLPYGGWVAIVRQEMNHPSLTKPIPSLLEHSAFAMHEIESAQACKVARRLLLRRYRAVVVLPSLRERDQQLYLSSASNLVAPFQWCRSTLLPEPEPAASTLLDLDLGCNTWRFYRVWAIVRISGGWPLCCYTGSGALQALEFCPLCWAPAPTVLHCLCACPVTASLHRNASLLHSFRPRADSTALTAFLFGPCDDASLRSAQIGYVGGCIHAVLSVGRPLLGPLTPASCGAGCAEVDDSSADDECGGTSMAGH
jgi:hypothetical protein